MSKYSNDTHVLDNALRRIFDSEDGKLLMKYWDDHYFNTISFCPDNHDKTVFNEGQRDLIFDIKKRITHE